MKRCNLITVLLLFIFSTITAQKKSPSVDLGILRETKSKIEKTVPLVVQHLQKISAKEGDNSIINNGKSSLAKEYDIVKSEWFLYRNNMKNCILNNSSKKIKKCMEYHNNMFRGTMVNYNNYITHLTRKNGYLGVEGETKFEFNPIEISAKLSEAYLNAISAVKGMKSVQKKEFLEQTMADDTQLAPFSQLAK